MAKTDSLLPLFLILWPFLGAILVQLFGDGKRRLTREGIAILGMGVQLAAALLQGWAVFGGTVLESAGSGLRVDALSALMALLINGVILLVLIQSVRYMQQEEAHGLTTPRRLRLYYALILIFAGAMNWTVTTNHLILLYVAMEASTLATALLVAFYRNKSSLEAGFKYVLLVMVGMTFSLLGMVLIFAAAHPLMGSKALLLPHMGEVARLIPRKAALLGVGLMTAGFATKAGLVPFHAWLPDAHSEAPSPVSALLSGLIIKLGAYALARTVTLFAPAWHGVPLLIAILAAASMLIGIMMALVQDDLKRMLAFSSVSQIGYVFMGLGLGSYLGVYAGLFHLVNHTLIKSLLFMSTGAIMYATSGVRRISQLGGLARRMPVTSFCFILGALALGGLPPLNAFLSKFTLFIALGEAHLWWALIIAILTGLLTLACLVRAAYKVFWAPAAVPEAEAGSALVREVPFLMYFSMAVLAGLSLLIGLFPGVLYPLLDGATRAVLAVWTN
ncbi:MAG TPA: proton-conducting transporter membrane subunit [bacterium]|nr:proton-conducting transporter membrane subunit [bacterium]HPR88136.1 proton-conducting transporter membrane subunit [bacterium]